MGKIVPVGTGREDVKVWLDEVSKMETHIYVELAAGSENDELAKAEAERIKNTEMLVLRHQGFEMPAGFKPEAAEQSIDGAKYTVIQYVFQWTDCKYEVMCVKKT